MAAPGGGPARLLTRGSKSGAATRALWRGCRRALETPSREQAGRAANRTKMRRLASRRVMAPHLGHKLWGASAALSHSLPNGVRTFKWAPLVHLPQMWILGKCQRDRIIQTMFG